jgi:3-oxoacyl-[acyl-carrier-protein] synthase-3
MLAESLPAARARLAQTGGRLHFVGHQANMLVLEAVSRRAEISEAEHWHNVVLHGNTASAGAPSVISQRWAELGAGDVMVVAVVGAGLTWAGLRLEVDAP